MKKTAKKVNPKNVQKEAIKNVLREALNGQGEIFDGVDFGFTKDTLVLRTEVCDVQIKLIAPKTDVIRYELLEDAE